MHRLFEVMKTIFFLISFMVIGLSQAEAQAITGVWRGKVTRGIKNYNLELKLIRNGDSLSGTSYYYHSTNNYSRFKVKGYSDISGDIVWWDEVLIESKGGKISSPNSTPFRFAADFNCPGNDIMKLDGTADKEGSNEQDHEVHLSKVDAPMFKDEWDEVIEDFPVYAGDPNYIDSVERSTVAKAEQPPASRQQGKKSNPARTGNQGPKQDVKPTIQEPVASTSMPPDPKPAAQETVTQAAAPQAVKPVAPPEPMAKTTTPQVEKRTPEKQSSAPVTMAPKQELPLTIKAPAPKTIEEKFIERKKILVTEIPVSGDSIKLSFYDNAEVDGDSITLFLNNRMIQQHILLKATAFEVTIPVSDLASENELTMVAENLGSIPPNTSLMIIYVNGVRHEARLESTENSSAMIRFKKEGGSIKK
jgi:hypothetical protein